MKTKIAELCSTVKKIFWVDSHVLDIGELFMISTWALHVQTKNVLVVKQDASKGAPSRILWIVVHRMHCTERADEAHMFGTWMIRYDFLHGP